jgi:hypothetical protein
VPLYGQTLISTNSFAQESEKISNQTENSSVSDAAAKPYFWDDLRITLDNGNGGAALSYFSGTTAGPQIYYFRNNDGLEAMSFTVQLPHSWKEGSRIYPHLHWTPKQALSGNIEWNFDYTWANYNSEKREAFPPIKTNTVLSTGPFEANTHDITVLTKNNEGIDGIGKKVSSVLICRIWRYSNDVDDTYNGDAGALFLDFHIQVDGFGSRQEYVK